MDDWRSRGRRGGRYRGHRERGGQHHHNDRDGQNDDQHFHKHGATEQPPPGLRGRELGMWHARKRGHRPPHPEGLTGREIGMFYAKRSKEKMKREDKANRQCIQMDKEKEDHLRNLISSIREDNGPQAGAGGSHSRDNTHHRGASGSHSRDNTHHRFNYDRNEYSKPSCSHDRWDEEDIDENTKGVKTEQVSDNWEDLADNQGTASAPAESCGRPIPKTSDICSLDYIPLTSSTPASSVSLEPSKGWEQKYEAVSDSDNDDDDNMVQLAKDAEKLSGRYWDELKNEPMDEEDLPPEVIAQLFTPMEDDNDYEYEYSQNERRNSFGSSVETCERTCISRKPGLDDSLQIGLQDKQNDPQYQRMKEFRRKLPSFQHKEEVLRVIQNNKVTVISGETGCGKTTQVTQFILDDYIERGCGSLCRIVCTQPRRISAISVAERVAAERAETCGQGSVGYQIRLESRRPRDNGSILYCTTGILLKWLVSDPLLSKTSHVILDEIHERDVLSDFLMIILRDLMARRDNLKLILMSATLNAEMFSQYFNNCPMLNIPGFTFPVKEYLLEEIVEELKYRHDDPPEPRQKRRRHGPKFREERDKEEAYQGWVNTLYGRYSPGTLKVLGALDEKEIDLDLHAALIDHIVMTKPEGAILVFMPGWEQIRILNDKLSNRHMYRSDRFKIIPLHSLMPTCNQREVFDRPPPGVRKIVIATNIAETSITIEDVVYVIDSGKIKMKNFDVDHNITTLQPEWVSRANARQRRGRAGRVQPGECYHLYTEYHEAQFSDHQLPEMLRTRLEELCLQIKLLKLGRIEGFIRKAMQPPSLEALRLSIQMLMDLNALDDREQLTPLGYHLAKMPVDPHTGKMLIFGSLFCCMEPVLTVAASLSFKDAFFIPLGKEKIADDRRRELAGDSKSDHIMLVKAYEGWERAKRCGNAQQYCWNNFLSPNTLKMLQNMRKQFTTLLHELGFLANSDPSSFDANRNSANEKLVKAVICAGLYPNVAKIKRPKRGRRMTLLQTKTERSVNIHPKSVNVNVEVFPSPWVVYHLKMRTIKVYLYDCTIVSPYPLLFFGGAITLRKDEGDNCIVVDDYITFRASTTIADLVKALRMELDNLLERRILHPGVTSWDPKTKDGALMRAISDLITTEESLPVQSDNPRRYVDYRPSSAAASQSSWRVVDYRPSAATANFQDS